MSELRQLVQRASSEDKSTRDAAFDALMTRYKAMAFQRAYATLGDRYLAEEAVQEAFIVAYLRLEQLKDPNAFPAWLRRIVLTQCDRLIRGKRPTLEPIEHRYDLAEDKPTPEAHLVGSEMRDHIYNAIAALPEHERAVTQGFYLEGESQKEIAAKLQVPVTTVKKRLQYARQHLRAFFQDLNAAVDLALDDLFSTTSPPPEPARLPIYVHNTDTHPPESD